MRQFDQYESKGFGQSLKSTLMLLAFGLTILGYLVSVDHPEWFHLRPTSGTAVAMSLASDDGGAKNTAEGR